MPVEGRRLSWKETQEVTKEEGLARSLVTPESAQKLQAALSPGRRRSHAASDQRNSWLLGFNLLGYFIYLLC
jgi:hypothetical protein